MRCFVRLWLSLAIWCAAVQAQPSNGYLFVAPGGATCCGHTAMTWHFGLGGEGVIGKGVGVGAEIGAVGPRERFGDGAVGVFSANGYYHFVHGNRVKLDPFLTGGYSLLFRSGHANLFNFGGGATYWFHRNLGFRVEFRDHVYREGSALHYWGFRFGVSFGGSS